MVSFTTTTYNSVATYSCNTGYTLTGDDMRTCQSSGVCLTVNRHVLVKTMMGSIYNCFINPFNSVYSPNCTLGVRIRPMTRITKSSKKKDERQVNKKRKRQDRDHKAYHDAYILCSYPMKRVTCTLYSTW